jgi:unsaturated chondroitin disaccharide hydrolase
LEILFWSAANGGNATWHDMAVSHANKTGLEWIRRDGSTFHLVVFDPMTGAVISKSGTPQGMAVNSTWARGQGWAIYGFTMAYRTSRGFGRRQRTERTEDRLYY